MSLRHASYRNPLRVPVRTQECLKPQPQEKSYNPLATPLSYILSPHDPQVQSFRLKGFKYEPVSQDRHMIEAPDLLFRHKLHLSCRGWPLEAFGKKNGMQGPYDIYNIQVSARPPKTLCSVANRVSAFSFLPTCR